MNRNAVEDEIFLRLTNELGKRGFARLERPESSYNRNEKVYCWQKGSPCHVILLLSVFDDFRDPDIDIIAKVGVTSTDHEIRNDLHQILHQTIQRPFQQDSLKPVLDDLSMFIARIESVQSCEVPGVLESYPAAG